MTSVALRAMSRSEAGLVAAWERHPDNAPFVIPWCEERHVAALCDPDSRCFILDAQGVDVGFVLLAGITRGRQSVEFRRIVVVEKGRGYGRAAVEAVKRYCFEELGRRRLWLDVFEENARARALYEATGFRVARTLRDAVKRADGSHTLVVMEMLSSDHFHERPQQENAMSRRVWFDRRFTLGVSQEAFPDILERLRGTPLRLTERTSGVPDALLTTRVAGRWSIQEHAGHLADLEVLWLGRLDDFATGAPALRPADLENRATWEGSHNSRSLDDVVAEFRTRRERFVARVGAMSADELAATAAHPRLGQPMTVVDLCFFVAEHDDHHLAAISELRGGSA